MSKNNKMIVAVLFAVIIIFVYIAITFFNSKDETLAQTPEQNQIKNRACILIGLDGFEFDYYKSLSDQGIQPGINRLYIKKAYSAGQVGTPTQQNTLSAPSWTSILTGTYVNKHKVEKNWKSKKNPDFPTIFKFIRDESETAQLYSVTAWGAFNRQILKYEKEEMDEQYYFRSNDLKVFEKIQELLTQEDEIPDQSFYFAHFDDIDEIGHKQGFSEKYVEKIQKSDEYVGKILDQIEKRQQNFNEEWLVLLTSDHSRDDKGVTHGKYPKFTEKEKVVLIGSNKGMNLEFNSTLESKNADMNQIYSLPSQASISPTILQYLGVEKVRQNQFDDIPLMGPVGLQKLTLINNQFEWSYNGSNIRQDIVELNIDGEFYKNLSLTDQKWPLEYPIQDKEKFEKGTDFQFILNGISVSYQKPQQGKVELQKTPQNIEKENQFLPKFKAIQSS